MSAGVFCLASIGDWRSRSLKSYSGCTREVEGQTGWLGCVIYFTDQLRTPYFSGGSTINGTPGGDRWARVVGGQIGWLSDPLRRVHGVCSGSTNLKMQTHGKREKIRPTQNTPQNPQQPGDTSNSRWHARKHVPSVSPYSPASIDPEFVEIGHVQLSLSVKTTNVTHTPTD